MRISRKFAVWRRPWREELHLPVAVVDQPAAEAVEADLTGWHLHIPYATTNLLLPEPISRLVSGHIVTLKEAEPRNGSLVVENLPTVDEARHVFDAIVKGVLAAGLNLSTGFRVRDNLAVLHGDEDPFPNEQDQPFVCRQIRDRRRAYIVADAPSFVLDRVLETFWGSMEAGFRNASMDRALADARVALACRIFTDSHFESSGEAKFLTLMGVLEVLKDKDETSDAAHTLIEGWISESYQLDGQEGQSIRSALNFMRTISIGKGIRRVVDRHLGAERAKGVPALYNARSMLLHEGKRPENINRAVWEAEGLARDLLISILMRGAVGCVEDGGPG